MKLKEKLLTTRETSHILGVSEKEVISLASSNSIPHFKVAGEFFRFKKEDILRVKKAIKQKYNIPDKKHNRLEALREFFYFNDFYIAAMAIIVVLLWVIVKDLVSVV